MPDFDFKSLSPTEFEHLARDLLQAEWGVTLETFMEGRDGGIDNRVFTADGGTTVVQAKHYARSGYSKLLAALRKEADKVERLAPDRYVVVTSVELSPHRKSEVAALFGPTRDGDVYGRNDLNNLLGLHPEVEKRHLALWMPSTAILEEVLDASVAPAREAAEETRDLVRETRNLILAREDASATLKAVLARQAETVRPLLDADRLDAAADQLRSHLAQTADLRGGASPAVRDLLDHHGIALRIQLGDVLARGADHAAAREQFAALTDPASVPDDLVEGAARLAFHARDAAVLAVLRDRTAEGSHERRLCDLWLAICVEDWDGVIEALNAFPADDPGRTQTRARALLELGRDRQRTARLLDEAWAGAARADLRLAVAIASADLVEAVVDREEEAPGLDRTALIQTTTARLRRAAEAPTLLLKAHARFRAAQWFAFLGDSERRHVEEEAFESLALSEDQRSHFVIDAAVDDRVLRQRVREGTLDPAIHEYLRAHRFHAVGDKRREEGHLWSAFESLTDGPYRNVVAERLLDLRLDADDVPGAEQVLDAVGEDDPFHPLLAVKVIEHEGDEAAAREALRAVLERRPRCRPALRMLFAYTESAALEAEGRRRHALADEADGLLERLHLLVPSRSQLLVRADFYRKLGRPADAVDVYVRLAEREPLTPVVLRSKSQALVLAGRLPDAARTLEEAYAADPSDPATGSEAGRLWMEAVRYPEAVRTLSRVAADHPREAVPLANLGFSRLNHPDPDVRRTALDAFQAALDLDPDLGIEPFPLFQAASLADDPVAARRYMEEMTRGARRVDVGSEEDAAEAMTLRKGERVVQGRFDGKDSLRAFLQHLSKEADARERLATSDMAPFVAVARRPWTARLLNARAFRQQNRAAEAGRYTVRAPWPSEAALHPVGAVDADHPLGPFDGLLIDLTSLVTLVALDALGDVLRAAKSTFGRVVLYPGALDDLRDEIRDLTTSFGDGDAGLATEIVSTIDRHALGLRPGDPGWADLAAAVPEAAAYELGNTAPDVGLALHLGAGFVAHVSSYDTPEERQWGGHTWSSAEVLHALRRENRIGRSTADEIAETAPQTFEEWEAAAPPPLEPLVVTGFVLDDWQRSGLLDLWVRHLDEWPALRVGPFGVDYVRGQVQGSSERLEVARTLEVTLDTLERLLSEDVIEAPPRTEETPALDEDTPPVWGQAVRLIGEAAHQDLHVWADDRALGFLLWTYDTPISTPGLDAAAQRIRERFASTGLLSTEMVLERLTTLPSVATARLGWGLYETGYRPLLGRLALRHLLADYGPPVDGPPYDAFLSVVGALRSFLPDEEVLPAGRRREAYVNVAAVPVLDALLDVAWNDPGLDPDVRRQLADEILDACWPLLDTATASTLGLSIARLMISMGWHRERDDDALPTAEVWLGDALTERLPFDRLQAVTRRIEDLAVVMYRQLHDRAMEDVEGGDPEEEETVVRIAAQIAWQRLTPLFESKLLNVHAPLLRRALAVLAGSPESGQATRTVRRGVAVPIPVEEEEMEVAAVNAFEAARADPGLERLFGLTRVHGVWKRPLSKDQRARIEGAPESHPVEIDVPYLTLALRDEDGLREAILFGLAHGLDVVDPVLRETVRALHDGLVAEDPERRSRAVDRLADAAIGSVALDLERDLAHAADRLRDRSLDELSAWLFNPARPPEPSDNSDVVDVGDGGRMPRASVLAGALVSTTPESFGPAVVAVAHNSVRAVEEGGRSLDEGVTALADLLTTAPSSFEAVYHVLVLLVIAEEHPDTVVELGSAPVPVTGWVREVVADLLVGDRAVGHVAESLRAGALRAAHAFALRLALHACSDPDVLQELQDQSDDDDALARRWTTHVLIAADRLLAFSADRYPDPQERAYRLHGACKTLGFVPDAPGQTFDRFNPLLFGPDLVNHERWVLLHGLDVSWDRLGGEGRPLWWSSRAEEALQHLADHPEPHEDLLMKEGVQNGLGMTLAAPPSELARRLVDRAVGRGAGPEGAG